MTDLIKIREVTERYSIPARTLRYYEDMGLIESARVADYAYRLYDRQALKRLEQILILRKLNISIKDIQLIFQAAGSETFLEVLGRKVEDITRRWPCSEICGTLSWSLSSKSGKWISAAIRM